MSKPMIGKVKSSGTGVLVGRGAEGQKTGYNLPYDKTWDRVPYVLAYLKEIKDAHHTWSWDDDNPSYITCYPALLLKGGE